MQDAGSRHERVHILGVQVNTAMENPPPGCQNAKSILNHHPRPRESVVDKPFFFEREIVFGVRVRIR